MDDRGRFFQLWGTFLECDPLDDRWLNRVLKEGIFGGIYGQHKNYVLRNAITLSHTLSRPSSLSKFY